jgi:hypothetical protein
MTNTAGDSCADCHLDNVAMSHVIDRGAGCGSCHMDSAYTGPISAGRGENGTTVTCHDCHFPNVDFALHTSLHDTTTLPDTSCESCHSANIAFEHVDNRGLQCVVCHNNPDQARAAEVEPVIASGILGNPVNCSDCHTGPFEHTSVHDMTDVPSPDCAACHNPNVVTEHVGRISTKDGHEISCADCHDNPAYNAIIQSGINGNKVYCNDCHTGVIDHTELHNDTEVPEPICEQCHDPNVVTEHVTVRGRDCSICHDNPDFQTIIEQGANNTITVTCASCHQTPDHHNNVSAQTGNCAFCHIDPRPLDNDPQQLACRECHIDNNGYVDTSAPAPSHAFNTDPADNNIKDFGACFACHAPVPYHAKPDRNSFDCWDTNPQSPTYISGLTPGRGTFNLFWSEFSLPDRFYRDTPYEEIAKDYCRQYRNDFDTPAINFYWFDIVYQGVTESVPAFDPAGPFPPYPHDRIMTDAGSNCADCHTVGSVIDVTHNDNCIGCHFSTVSDVKNAISAGRAGNDVYCSSCHGPDGHTFSSAHDISETPGCGSCHTDLDGTEAGIEQVHNTDRNGAGSCATCHNSTDPTTQGYITNGVPDALECSSCHMPHSFVDNHDISETPGCGSCHTDLDGTEAGIEQVHNTPTNGDGSCATCHNSTDPTTQGYITNGVPDALQCSDCHAPHSFVDNHDISETPGCGSCHTDLDGTEAGVEAVHDTDRNGAGSCATCHNSSDSTTQGYITDGVPNSLECADCHAAHSFNTDHQISETPGCATCHIDLDGTIASVETLHDVPTNGDGSCATCHNSSRTDVQAAIAAGVPVECLDCHMPHGATDHNKLGTASECSGCHVSNDFDAILTLHMSDCDKCHSSADQNVIDAITDGRNGIDVNCINCHGAVDHAASHSDTGVPDPACEQCHDPNVFVEHVVVHNRDCSICHNPTYQSIIDQGVNNQITVTCANCHAPSHHDTDTARQGYCTDCHNDPRPLDNDPKQLACRQCHIDSNGYVDTSAPAPSHAFNTDPVDNSIKDFGACFACHAPVLWHAKPVPGSFDCWEVVTDSPYYVPGLLPEHTRGGFNIFQDELQRDKSDYNNTQWEEIAETWCKGEEQKYRQPAFNFYWFDIVYQGMADSVPAFDMAYTFPSYPHDMIQDDLSTNCGQCHTVGSVIDVTHNNDCMGCHFSKVSRVEDTISAGRAGFDVSCSNCHDAGGHDAQHDMTRLNQASCAECHVDNVVTEHLDNPALSCATCHDNPAYTDVINNGKNGNIVTCFDCHGTADHASLHITDVDEPGCADCHDPNVVTEHLVNQGLDCTNCHEYSGSTLPGDVPGTIAGNWSPKICSDCHGPTDHTGAHDNTGPSGGTNCTDCHSGNVVTEHVTNQSLTCSTCHDNPDPLILNLIEQGKSGNPQDYVSCEDCHGANGGDHRTVHDMASTPSTDCNACHQTNVIDEHLDNPALSCATCHESNDSQVQQAIADGSAGIPVTCNDCHGQGHHGGPEAQSGNCTYCHADPRLGTDPNAPSGQLACAECHGSYQHGNGGPIQDFGACFACHQPVPYHALTNTQPFDCWDTNPSYPGYIPGLTPGRGSFNLFYEYFHTAERFYRSTADEEIAKDYCRQYRGDFDTPAISYNAVSFFDFFNTQMDWVVPTFEAGDGSQLPTSPPDVGPPGGGDDTVTITYARYSRRSDRLTVYAESSMGNSVSLTVHYDGDTYDMNWDSGDNRFEAFISDSSCRDSTIEVTSSGGGSDTTNVARCY